MPCQGNGLSQKKGLAKVILAVREARPQGPQTHGGCGETQGWPRHWELSLCGGQGLWPCRAGHCLAGPNQGTWGQSSPGVGGKLPGRGGGRRAAVVARCLLTASWRRAPWREVADRPEESRAGQGRRANTAWAPATGPKDPARGQEGGGLRVKSPAVSHLHPSTGKMVTLNYRAGEDWMEHS